MEAMLPKGYEIMSPAPQLEKTRATPKVRLARTASVFAAIWLALALTSPLIVRYAPSADDHAMAAVATRSEHPRCANAPDSGISCQGRTLVARDADAGKEPDL